jgi:uncharacterized protein (UPF0303 family)
MPYKSNADKAAWARRKYHANEEFRKAEISAVIARRDERIAREAKAAKPSKSYPHLQRLLDLAAAKAAIITRRYGYQGGLNAERR